MHDPSCFLITLSFLAEPLCTIKAKRKTQPKYMRKNHSCFFFLEQVVVHCFYNPYNPSAQLDTNKTLKESWTSIDPFAREQSMLCGLWCWHLTKDHKQKQSGKLVSWLAGKLCLKDMLGEVNALKSVSWLAGIHWQGGKLAFRRHTVLLDYLKRKTCKGKSGLEHLFDDLHRNFWLVP